MDSPLHPAIVHFPIVLFLLSIICDWIGRLRQWPRAQDFAFWTLWGTAVTDVLTVIAGFIDFNRAHLAQTTTPYVWQHMKIGIIILLAVAGLTIWRTWGKNVPNWPYLGLGTVAAGIVLFQAWFGGEMVYALGAGVSATGQGMAPGLRESQGIQTASRALNSIPGMGSGTPEQATGNSREAKP